MQRAPWHRLRPEVCLRWGRADLVLLLLILVALTTCSNKMMQQSPVDITGYTDGVPTLFFGFNDIGADHITNTGDFVKVKYEGGGSILVGEGRDVYPLTEIHVHNPSEHTVEGEQFALETHMVFSRQPGEIAVVGLLYRLGSENAAIQQIIDSAPSQGEGDVKPSSPLKMASFLPEGYGYYAYMGSLTTPPFTEGVHWFVMSDVLEVSEEQVREIAALTGGGTNNREIQPLNGRVIRAFEVD